MNTQKLIVPDDNVGWTDETFIQALRFVMQETTLVDVSDMQRWVQNRIQPGSRWLLQNVAISGPPGFPFVFKRSILLSFRHFPPSTLNEAFVEIMEHTRPHRQWRNIYYHGLNILVGLIVAFFVILLIINLL